MVRTCREQIGRKSSTKPSNANASTISGSGAWSASGPRDSGHSNRRKPRRRPTGQQSMDMLVRRPGFRVGRLQRQIISDTRANTPGWARPRQWQTPHRHLHSLPRCTATPPATPPVCPRHAPVAQQQARHQDFGRHVHPSIQTDGSASDPARQQHDQTDTCANHPVTRLSPPIRPRLNTCCRNNLPQLPKGLHRTGPGPDNRPCQRPHDGGPATSMAPWSSPSRSQNQGIQPRSDHGRATQPEQPTMTPAVVAIRPAHTPTPPTPGGPRPARRPRHRPLHGALAPARSISSRPAARLP